MKRNFILALFFSVLAIGVFGEDIALPKPAQKADVDLFSAIQNRRVSRSFVKKSVSLADLSTILWAGLGARGADAVSSATKADRTISFSGNNAYINAYVLDSKGTWKYLSDKQSLKLVSSGDSRTSVSKAAIPDAAFMILFTVDTALTPSFLKANPTLFLQMAHATAGFAAQNMELAASALKMAAIVQYTLTPAAAATAAGLGKEEVPLFILQAGYTE
jgi:nitroreductase